MTEPTHTRASRRTAVITTVLGVVFASPVSLFLGLLAADALRGGGIPIILVAPALLAFLIAVAARLRVGVLILPALALASVAGWGLLALSQASLD